MEANQIIKRPFFTHSLNNRLTRYLALRTDKAGLLTNEP